MNHMVSKYSVRPAKVVSNIEIAKDIYMLELEPLHLYEMPQPFNFFMIWVPRVDEIPLSIADFDGKKLKFLYKIKGDGTKALAKYRKDMTVGIKGPLGRGINIKLTLNNRWLVIAGGIGIAPVPYLIRIWRKYGANIDLLWGVKTVDEIFNIHEFFPSTMESRIIIATEDCRYRNGYCGTVVDILKHVNVKEYNSIIAVGPNSMLKVICLELYELNPYIALETMVKCGMGICGSCYIRASNKLLCIDGPLFSCSEVIEYLRSNNIS